MQVVVAPLGPLAVGGVFGLGHLLGGLLELVLQLDQTTRAPTLTTSINVSPGSKSSLLPQQADADPGPHEELAIIGLIEPRQDLDQVVLPAPLGPTRPIRSPARISKAELVENRIADVTAGQALSGDEDH